jgi:hypothetical protein
VKKLLFGAIFLALTAPAIARDLGRNAYLTRVIKCVGVDATMEIYLPQSALSGGSASLLSLRPTNGWFGLDLSAAKKGKSLEPVRISVSSDKKALIVDQYTRKLPATRVPLAGGVVNFDQRFGTNANCEALGS